MEEKENFLQRRVCEAYNKIRKIIKELKIDVILSPGLITHNTLLGCGKNNDIQCFYTFLFNLLNMRGGAVPVTKVKEDEQYYEDGINDEFIKSFKDQLKGSEGLPIGVHISVLCWKDEEVFYFMKIIQEDVKFFNS